MTELLKCPLLPGVEPELYGTGEFWVYARGADSLGVDGSLADSPEEAIALWNAWMQPLHDLQAERDNLDHKCGELVIKNFGLFGRIKELEALNERQAERIAQLEAEIKQLQSIRQQEIRAWKDWIDWTTSV